MPAPGEPFFTQEDTDAAIALAEEERATCSSCGWPKAVCRDKDNAHRVFQGEHEFCWATYAVDDHRKKLESEKMSRAQWASVQMWAGIRPGREPDLTVGLDLGEVEVD